MSTSGEVWWEPDLHDAAIEVSKSIFDEMDFEEWGGLLKRCVLRIWQRVMTGGRISKVPIPRTLGGIYKILPWTQYVPSIVTVLLHHIINDYLSGWPIQWAVDQAPRYVSGYHQERKGYRHGTKRSRNAAQASSKRVMIQEVGQRVWSSVSGLLLIFSHDNSLAGRGTASYRVPVRVTTGTKAQRACRDPLTGYDAGYVASVQNSCPLRTNCLIWHNSRR